WRDPKLTGKKLADISIRDILKAAGKTDEEITAIEEELKIIAGIRADLTVKNVAARRHAPDAHSAGVHASPLDRCHRPRPRNPAVRHRQYHNPQTRPGPDSPPDAGRSSVCPACIGDPVFRCAVRQRANPA